LSAVEVEAGFLLLVELLGQFQNIALPSGVVHLKWIMNPTASELRALLLSKSTRFVFADFEASGGVWAMGDGTRRCYTNSAAYVCCDTPEAASFDLDSVRGQLEHVRLMRIFHCNSLYDPYIRWAEPVDDGTLASALLATGAIFVEGSVTAEPITDFVCTMLGMLLRRADLRAILTAKGLERGGDSSSLIAEANMFVSKRGFQSIG
jgi:hypothetical protein